jgi:glycosyl hydrolase family 26
MKRLLLRLAVVLGVLALAVGPSLAVPAHASPAGVIRPATIVNTKTPCISGDYPGGEITPAYMARVDAIAGITFACANTFDNPSPNWSTWEEPWQFSGEGSTWQNWLTSGHQMIMAQDLIPQKLEDMSDPLTWEADCAAGDYNSKATALATYLLDNDAGSIWIRLGPEANGNWEADSVIGTDPNSADWATEESDWGECFRSEVNAMRAVSGTHFRFTWNVNVCTGDIPLRNWYPGDAVVDVIGVDAYDVDCSDNKDVKTEGWTAYYTDSHDTGANPPPTNSQFPSLKNIVAFAAESSHLKSLGIPEWGLTEGDDDPAYVDGIASVVSSNNTTYQTYYDNDDDGIAPLGDSTIPNSTAEYVADFG